MKKVLFILAAVLTLTLSAQAMSYEQARNQALFLTDKMAYELNLTEEQYQAAYEINLDYLMSVNTVDDLYGAYWTHRNLDLSYILLDWQYRSFCAATYFYRPLSWDAGYWHFGIYARYPHRDYFYFGRPSFYAEYRGGHSWHMNGGRSWYHGRDFGGPRQGGREMGMRDNFNRGSYGRGGNIQANTGRQDNRTRTFGNQASRNGGTRSFGGQSATRQSSTRTTVSRGPVNTAPTTRGNFDVNRSSSFGGTRSQAPRSTTSAPRSTFSRPSNSGSSFGGSRGGGSSMGSGSRSGGLGGGSRGGSFGGHR